MSEISFNLGQGYTRQEIHDRVGGPLQGMLPTVEGKVVCCCVTRDPGKEDTPKLMIGDFAHQYPAARQWAAVKQAVPLFLKRQPNSWEFMGDFRVAEASAGDDPKVRIVLHLEAVEVASNLLHPVS